MLDLIASVIFQLAALCAAGTTETTSAQTTNPTSPEPRIEVSNAGGTGGWNDVVATSGNTGR